MRSWNLAVTVQKEEKGVNQGASPGRTHKTITPEGGNPTPSGGNCNRRPQAWKIQVLTAEKSNKMLVFLLGY